jgi:hypothetical protein
MPRACLCNNGQAQASEKIEHCSYKVLVRLRAPSDRKPIHFGPYLTPLRPLAGSFPQCYSTGGRRLRAMLTPRLGHDAPTQYDKSPLNSLPQASQQKSGSGKS